MQGFSRKILNDKHAYLIAMLQGAQSGYELPELILWTCREGLLLRAAVQACREWGLTFDAIDESLPDWIEAFGTRPRKVGAAEYWDDRAVRMP